jgi:hypothetical protein
MPFALLPEQPDNHWHEYTAVSPEQIYHCREMAGIEQF